jgi:hypothetical protein
MIYRYKLKPTAENLELKSRVINGVKLSTEIWVQSDTPLSFSGFEGLVMSAKLKDDDKTKHVAKRIEDMPPVSQEPRQKRKYVKKLKVAIPSEEPIMPIEIHVPAPAPAPVFVKPEPTVRVYGEDELYQFLLDAGFHSSELIGLSHVHMYELALIDLDIVTLQSDDLKVS